MFVSIEKDVDEKANLTVRRGDAMVEVADLNRPFNLQCALCHLSVKEDEKVL